MRVIVAALSCAAIFGFATAAYADDSMSNTYGNTVSTRSEKTPPLGGSILIRTALNTASARGAKGQAVSYGGAWTLKDSGATICLAPKLPPNSAGSAPSCSPLMKHNVGDSWTVTNDLGETFDISMTAGH